MSEVLSEIPENWLPSWERLDDDTFFDEVRVVPSPGSKGPHIKLTTHLYYKTSELSGDEWRTRMAWESAPDEGGFYTPFDDGYLTADFALKAFFPGIYTSHKDWAEEIYSSIDFYRKRQLLYRATYEGTPVPLLVHAGHAPWAEVAASEQCGGLPAGWEKKCFQPGCSFDATSVVMLKGRFDRRGTPRKSYRRHPAGLQVDCRAFCQMHRRRGDCGLDDADANYLHVSGTTLEQSRGAEHFERPSIRIDPGGV